MKTLICTSRNIRAFLVEGQEPLKLEPEIEGIFTLIDKSHAWSGMNLVPTSNIETFRFSMDIETAKRLISSIQEWVDCAEDLQDKLIESKQVVVQTKKG